MGHFSFLSGAESVLLHRLQRFEKTNEMLLNFNSLSRARFDTTQLEFRKHTTLIASMKKDLDAVFKRIRCLEMSALTWFVPLEHANLAVLFGT